jgi:hypothetical protein
MKDGKIAADVGIDALNATIKKKLGGLAAKQVLDVGNQVAVFKDNLARMFEDLGPAVEPFLKALHEVLEIFDQSLPSGRALKAVVTGVFTSLFAIAQKVLPYVKFFLLQLVIEGLKVYITLKPIIKYFKELFDTAGGGATLRDVLAAIASYLAGAIGGMLLLVAAGTAAFQVLTSFYASIWELFSGGYAIAANFVEGLIQGILGGVGRAVEAARNLASSALGAVKGVLGIASPSKALAEMGGHTAAGFAQGLEKGQGQVQGSMQDMVSPPQVERGKSQGGGRSIDVGGVTISINGVKDAESLKDLLPTMIAQLFEQVAIEQGV